MRIFVCVKQVPDTSGVVAVNPDGTLNRASMQTIINPDDLIAMEQALVLKDNTGCQVTAVTMGPPPAEGMLRELLAMGADDAILISAREFGGSSTRGTAGRIFSALAHKNINVKMIDQGSSELNIIIGVANDDFETAIKAIYDIFVITRL